MKKVILLSSVLLAVPFMMNGETQAADCVTQNCPTLGYTEASNTGNCVKCPFGNFWACPKIEEKAVLGQCTGYAKNCKIGDILNNDGTCTTNKESGKTPIGIVVYISGGSDKCGYAMTASPIASSIRWSTEYVNTGAFQSSSWSSAIKDFDVSGNMTKIIQSGNASTYPAAYAAMNYAPSAAPTSKGKWMLPTAGISSCRRAGRSGSGSAGPHRRMRSALHSIPTAAGRNPMFRCCGSRPLAAPNGSGWRCGRDGSSWAGMTASSMWASC